MSTDPDSTEPTAADPANLAEALPESDRGQGAFGNDMQADIAEAASEGVNLTDDGTGPEARSAGTGSGGEEA
jgi:hypothetical protein